LILAPTSLSSRYHAAHPLFALAFDWLGRQAGAAFSPGRCAIRGEDLYASFDQGMTRPAESGRFEAHRRYIDIQVCL
jgi:YhcH/YjgK/YiaL family protein